MDPYIEGHRYFDEWTDNYGEKYYAAQDYSYFLLGYYPDHPALHGWVNPGEFVDEH